MSSIFYFPLAKKNSFLINSLPLELIHPPLAPPGRAQARVALRAYAAWLVSHDSPHTPDREFRLYPLTIGHPLRTSALIVVRGPTIRRRYAAIIINRLINTNVVNMKHMRMDGI